MGVPVKIIRWINKHSISVYYRMPQKIRAHLRSIYGNYRVKNTDRFITAEIDGIKYNLDLNEEIDNSIYYQGCFEPMTVRIINKYVTEGMTVFDVGANMGCHTLRFAKLVGPAGLVVAFEPTSNAYGKIKKNIELNNLGNIRVEKVALSDKNRKKQRISFQSSYPLNGNARETSEFVDFITLDEYVADNKIGGVDLIKMDVDGFEYKIIQGGKNLLAKHRPIIIMEMGIDTLKKAGDDLNDLIDTLIKLGYRFYSDKNLREYKDKKSLVDAIPKIKNGTINVLCKTGTA